MNLSRLKWVFMGVLVIIWLSWGALPYKITVLEEVPRISYDTFISSQEFILKKKLDKMKNLKTSNETKLELKEELAHVLWSCRKYDEALKLYQDANAIHEKKGYSQKLINNLICLAGMYRDLNRLDDSIACYERIWKLDKAHLPANDPFLARDQTSMAVIAYVVGETQQNDKKHERYMKNCLAHIDQAQEILQGQTTPQTARLANLFYLKYLAYRELDEKEASKQCRKAADWYTKQMKRPFVLPWT